MSVSSSELSASERRNPDRRRHGQSMIKNFAEYAGPERRSGQDRRQPRLDPANHAVPTIRVPGESR